jgi:hypothetical protein
MGQISRQTRGLLLLLALVAAVALVLIYGQRCSGAGGQYAQLGQEMQGRLESGTIPASYAYVADVGTKQYWPNAPRYVDAIPQARRVYILDAATLAEFKGYEPGPL